MSNGTNGTNVVLDDSWSGKYRQVVPLTRGSIDNIERAVQSMAEMTATLARQVVDMQAIVQSLRTTERDGLVADSKDQFRDAVRDANTTESHLNGVSA